MNLLLENTVHQTCYDDKGELLHAHDKGKASLVSPNVIRTRLMPSSSETTTGSTLASEDSRA